jgi:hypothetical protein
MGKIILRGLVLLLVVLVLGSAGWTWLTLHWNYSEGERAGYVQKFSRKGWLCKTWEGEIAMVTMPGAIPDKFYFSVRDKAVADKINSLSGKRVVLTYEQHKFVPTSCFAETEYYVTDAKVVGETVPPVPALAVPPLEPAAPGQPAATPTPVPAPQTATTPN